MLSIQCACMKLRNETIQTSTDIYMKATRELNTSPELLSTF